MFIKFVDSHIIMISNCKYTKNIFIKQKKEGGERKTSNPQLEKNRKVFLMLQ